MKYQQKTFTLPTTTKRMTQTEYEIAVGLRRPDGSLVLLSARHGRRLGYTGCVHDPAALLQRCPDCNP